MEVRVEGPRGIVEHEPVASHFADVLRVGHRIHGYDEVIVKGSSGMPILVDPDLIPGRETLYVRRKQVFSRDGNPHTKDGLHEEPIGTCRSGSVYVCQLDCKVIYRNRCNN